MKFQTETLPRHATVDHRHAGAAMLSWHNLIPAANHSNVRATMEVAMLFKVFAVMFITGMRVTGSARLCGGTIARARGVRFRLRLGWLIPARAPAASNPPLQTPAP